MPTLIITFLLFDWWRNNWVLFSFVRTRGESFTRNGNLIFAIPRLQKFLSFSTERKRKQLQERFDTLVSKAILTQFWSFFADFLRACTTFSLFFPEMTKMFIFDHTFWNQRQTNKLLTSSCIFFLFPSKTSVNNQVSNEVKPFFKEKAIFFFFFWLTQ